MPNTDYVKILNEFNNSKESLKEKFGLNFNPFPKSGIAVIDEPDDIVGQLIPVDKKIGEYVVQYIRDVMSNNSRSTDRNNISLLIRGDYGTGKTQMLMFLKYLLKNIKTEEFKPYVVYIDNPGQKFSEVVGNIVSQVGIENFRRYLWEEFWMYLDKTKVGDKTKLDVLKDEVFEAFSNNGGLSLFNYENARIKLINPGTQSYKYMLDNVIKGLSTPVQKKIIVVFKKYLLEAFNSKYKNAYASEYFYDVVSENMGVAKSWGNIIQGNINDIDKQEVYILNAVVDIVTKNEKCTNFVMLVDEFEEITIDRLKQVDKDTYIRNLRSFIDRDKNWCCVFAMTGLAFQKIELFSPPLADRIQDKVIDLGPLDEKTIKQIIYNYLSLARENNNRGIYPFDDTAINALLNVKDPAQKGLPRFVLKSCYQLLQRAVDNLPNGDVIDESFVKEYLSDFVK